MRKWIDLFEQQFAANDIEHFIKNVGVEHGTAELEDDIQSEGMDEIVSWLNGYAGMYGPTVEVFRGLSLRGRPINYEKLGVSWTHDFHNAINEHGPEGGFGRPGHDDWHTDTVLRATVSHNDVDWVASFAIMRVEGEGDLSEPELRLKAGATVHIHQVYHLNRSAFTANDWSDYRPLTPEEADVQNVEITGRA